MIKKYLKNLCVSIIVCIFASSALADFEGQTIQIYTRFHAFVGNPTWLLVIRDLDSDQNLPYMFDIVRGDNFWVIFVPSRNYLISASRLQISSYQSRTNTFKNIRVNDFCNLESNGRIIKGESLYITIDGELRPNRDAYNCNVSSYPSTNFSIAKPSLNER